MAEQDKPTLVPAVLNDLVDVDGTPSEGDMLRRVGGVWGTEPRAKLAVFRRALNPEAFNNNTPRFVRFRPFTDLDPDLSDYYGYDDAVVDADPEYINILTTGLYRADWSFAVEATDQTSVTAGAGRMFAYVIVNGETYGPSWLYIPVVQIAAGAVFPQQSLLITASCEFAAKVGDQVQLTYTWEATTNKNLQVTSYSALSLRRTG